MSIKKSFVVKHGLEVADNLIYTDNQKVGIGTTTPDYTLSVSGDISLSGSIYLPATGSTTVKTSVGIVSATSLSSISGINTSSLVVGDYVTGTYIQINTRITSIGSSTLGISLNHTNSVGVATTSFTFLRYKNTGQVGQALVSQGPGLPLIWGNPTSSSSGIASTAFNVVGGIASVTQLNVSGVSNLGVINSNDITVSGSGIFSGSTSSDLVRITQTGSGSALKVEDSTNPDSTSFIVDFEGKVGIRTNQPNYSLDVGGTTLLRDSLYLKGGQLTSRVGILSGTNRSIITGVDTSGIQVSDLVDDAGTDINPGTTIVSIGINSIGINPQHNVFGSPKSVSLNITREFYAGNSGEVLISRGPGLAPNWSAASNTSVLNISTTTTYYPTFVRNDGFESISIAKSEFVFVPSPGNLGIGSTTPTERLDVTGNIKVSGSISVGTTATVGFLTANNVNVSGTATVGVLTATRVSVAETVTATTVNALTYLGDGVRLSGIVTQVTAGIGVRLTSSQAQGKGSVNIDSYFPIGKTIFVTQNGKDTNSGLTESDSKRTIKAAAAIAFPGDTIKVFPGVYIEENPIYLSKRVAVEGTELRNCVVTPKYTNRDLFYVNNSCHITDISFIGPDMSEGAAVVALQPLAGVATDRFFDAARMIRYNLDFIASETVGYLTSTDYRSPAFSIPTGNPNDCKDDIKDIMKAVIHDITRGGNSKCVGAGKSYYTEAGALQHIVGVKTETIDAIRYAAGIARAVINNSTWGGKPVGVSSIAVTAASYSNITGVTTITATNHGLAINDPVKIVGLGFTCPSGPGTLIYPTGSYGYIFNVKSVINNNQFEVVVGQSTLPHTYVSGGFIQKYQNYQNQYTQVKDLAIQPDPITKFNNAVTGCSDVTSAIYSCVGVVTTIINSGLSVLGVGIRTSFPANAGIGTTSVIGITSAVYNNETGQTTIKAPTLSVREGDIVEIRDLLFNCTSSGTIGTQRYPSGKYGYEFDVTSVNSDGSFVVNTGFSTLAHNYIGGGYVVNRAIGVTTARYTHTTGITTITAPGARVKVGDIVRLHDLQFSCTSGAGTTTLYPTGNLGYDFKVLQVIGTGTTFVVNTGVSTIPHTYVSGGVVFPPYSPGVGPITQGPYIRNCTNFIGKSIGMKVDGFNAEPGDQNDIGVTGAMSVDSYTQYNQGGIGVSITNGAYAQLVSIFTICDDIAIFTSSGGQCDITNSNCSFGNYGLLSKGVGDYTTKSIYRYTGEVATEALIDSDTVVVSGVGNLRPYDGQTLHFGELYYRVNKINVTNGGSGYTQAPNVVISDPTGPSGIRAEAIVTVLNGSVTSIDIISTGSQYRPSDSPTVTIDPPPSGTQAIASIDFYPIYYTIESATLPSSGISTIVLNTPLNNTVGSGTTVYFSRLSLQIATSISLEWVGAGTNINTAKPALGGVTIQENEVVKQDGGQVVYTSTNQAGNFQIGDDFVVNQLTGTISGKASQQSIINTVTPLIIALGI